MPNVSIGYGHDAQQFDESITRFKMDLGPAARATFDLIYDRMYVDQGDGDNNGHFERFTDLNVKPLKALFTAFSGERYPDPPRPTRHWKL